MKTLIALLAVLFTASLFSGCASTDNAPNAVTVELEESYGPVKHTSRVKVPHDIAANGFSVRAFDQQDAIGERAEFDDPATESRGGVRQVAKGVSDEAELAVLSKEHLGLEVVFDQPNLVNQEAIAIANAQLQVALAEQNTEQVKAWGEIIGALAEAGLKAFVPVP